MKVLVTGAGGFIGAALCRELIARGDHVVGIDNLNDYYDPALKEARLDRLRPHKNFQFQKLDIADRDATAELFKLIKPDRVVNLAAQAGVRYSIENPHAYIDANIQGFMNILEGCRHNEVEHLVYASSSSVYGANTQMPFSTAHNVNHPVSLYAATKKANELMAHTYAHLYNLPVTGLRFFTVYGPWGRPDMSPFLFAKNIIAGEPINVFNNGEHARDFTYIDDIVDGIIKSLDQVAAPNPDWDSVAPDTASSKAPYRLYNIGNSKPVELLYFIECLEKSIGKKAIKNMLPMQPGDVKETYADIDSLTDATGYSPSTSIEEGVENFVKWYRGFYEV